MKVIAHRGVCTEALENSWDAFQKSVDVGADRIELDVHLSADGHLVIVHDEDLKRTAGIEACVADLTRKELLASVKLSNGEVLPFLDEVFERILPHIELNVEIKTEGKRIVEKVGELIRSSPHADKIIVSSFSEDTCAWMRHDFPEVKVAFLWDRSLWYPGAFRFGPEAFMKKHEIRIWHPDAKLVTPQNVARCHELGWQVVPYVGLKNESVDKEKLWAYLMTVGVDGFCTNYPRQLKLWLQEAQDDKSRFREHNKLVRPTP